MPNKETLELMRYAKNNPGQLHSALKTLTGVSTRMPAVKAQKVLADVAYRTPKGWSESDIRLALGSRAKAIPTIRGAVKERSAEIMKQSGDETVLGTLEKIALVGDQNYYDALNAAGLGNVSSVLAAKANKQLI